MTRFYRNFIALSFLFVLAAGSLAQTNSRMRLAQAYERNGNYEQALEIYLDFYGQGNRAFGIIRGIQNSYKRMHRYPELVQFLQKLNRSYPGNLNYKIELGRACFLNQQKEKALEHWHSILSDQPKNISVYRLIGRIMTELRLLDEAAEVYLQAIKKIPKQESLYREVAFIRRAQLDYEQATTCFLRYYLSNIKQKSYVRSQFISMAKDEDAALRISKSIQSFLETHPNDTGLLEYQATLHIRLKQYQPALIIYKRLKNITLLLQFAREAALGNAYPYAIEAYQMALIPKQRINKQNNIRFSLAQTHYTWAQYLKQNRKPQPAQEQIQLAQNIIETLVSQKEDLHNRWRGLELNGDIQNVFLHDGQQAQKLYRQTVSETKSGPLNERIRLKMAEIYLMQNNLEQARLQYNKIKDKRYQHQAKFQLAQLDYYQGNFTKALNRYDNLKKNLATRDTLINNVLEQLNQINAFRSDSASLAQFAKAEFLARQQKLNLAANQFAQLYQGHKLIAVSAGLNAAKLFIQMNKPEQAARILTDLLEKYPQHANADRALVLLAQISERKEKPEAALALYLQLIAKYPDSFLIDHARERARHLQMNNGVL